jgi:hypothetical protein
MSPYNDLDSDVDDITIEEGDRVFMAMVHPVDPHHFVRASSTVFGRLAEAFAGNSKPKDFHDIVPPSLHAYAAVFTCICRRLYMHMPPSLHAYAAVFTRICRRLYTHMPLSLVKLPLILSQSDANGTIPLSWSANPRPDSARSI